MLSICHMNKESLNNVSYKSACMLSIQDIHERLGHTFIDKLKYIYGIRYDGNGNLQCNFVI